ncbi:energy transducer TonB [Sphingomonas kyeonggiensis]|uniref:Protein TonB n=1 Tax=Sphingomonas kyeonggiensis TaxID=1268553 RepID=A0A7W6JX38_9SPHN|nr:energy transducer TonB [Sphingomonas kyeonggiensis]MBB4101157.1 protein TonB [Sphingomonas kyeonggiensis]
MSGYRPDGARHALGAVAALGCAAALIFALAAPMLVQRVKAPRLAVFDVNLQPPPPPVPKQAPIPPSPVTRRQISLPRPQVILPDPPDPVVDATPVPPPPQPELPAPSPSPLSALPPAPAPRAPVARDLVATVLSAVPPRYPIDSRRRREQGVVVLALLVGTDGRVKTISVSNSSGVRRLDDAALAAVRKWRWSPMLVGGVAVEVRGLVEIPFVLREP